MQVLFLGTAGTNKRTFLDRVHGIACGRKFKDGALDPQAASFLRLLDIDGEIKKVLGGPHAYAAYLDNPRPLHRRQIWCNVFRKTILPALEENCQHYFVIMHGVCYRDKDYFYNADPELLVKLRPTAIVTLIDDGYDVAREINRREEQAITGSSCSFAEALEWRQVETMFGDFLAEHLRSHKSPPKANIGHNGFPGNWDGDIPHFVVAVKHSPEMLHRLLFERSRLVIYFGHPITDVRLDPRKITEVNDALRQLSDRYTVFVPDTIDEFTVDCQKRDRKELQKAEKGGLIVKARRNMRLLQRWPIFDEVTKTCAVLPSDLKIETVRTLERVIKAHTERRDLRILRQGLNAMVAYRPFWNGIPSGGVDREMIEAASQNVPVFALHKKTEDGSPETMFRGIKTARTMESMDEILKQLELMQQEKTNRWRNEGIPESWEDP